MRTSRISLVSAALTAVAFAHTASAGEVFDLEPNDSLGSAQDLGPVFPGAVAIIGSLNANDVDFFSFELEANSLFGVSAFDFTPGDDFDNDSIVGLFDSMGNEIAFDDDDGPGFLSAFSVIVEDAGTYTLAISGFGDNDFIGDHDEMFNYKMVVNAVVIPAPGALALLALGAMRPRRRRKA